MNEEVSKEWLEDFIKNNPFDFKQGIINHCRQMDKLDIYEWIAEDELKIQKLQQELTDYKERNENAIEYIETHYLNANEPKLLEILDKKDKE